VLCLAIEVGNERATLHLRPPSCWVDEDAAHQ